MSSPLWFVKLIIKTFPQIFTFAKLTHVPGLGRLIEYALFENDDKDKFINNSIERINRVVDVY
jgi:hypothetical protein